MIDIVGLNSCYEINGRQLKRILNNELEKKYKHTVVFGPDSVQLKKTLLFIDNFSIVLIVL
jgi:hypothetical protein